MSYDYNDPSKLNMDNLKLRAYLENLNYKAMRSIDIEPESPPIYKSKNIDLMTDTPDKIAAINSKDLLFRKMNEDAANNAIVDDLNWRPSKIKSETTQEMIDEYKAQNQLPLITGIMQKTDLETFVPKELQIKPSELPLVEAQKAGYITLFLENEAKLLDLENNIRPRIDMNYNAETASIAAASTGAKRAKRAMTSSAEIDKLKDEIVNVDSYSLLQAQNKASDLGIVYKPKEQNKTIQRKIKTELTKQLKTLSVKKTKTQEQLDKEYNDETKMIDGLISMYKKRCDDNLFKIKEIENAIADSIQTDIENTTEFTRIENENAIKIKTMEEELNILNDGKLRIVKLPGETDEDYRLRLIQTGEATYDDKVVEEQAKLLQLTRCKNNLKKLLSSESKISTIANKLTPDERFEYNKNAPAINKKYLDTHGFDNKGISESEIAQFIQETLSTKNFSMIPSLPTAVASTAPTVAPVSPIITTGIAIKGTVKEELLKLSQENGLMIKPSTTVANIIIILIDNNIPIPKEIQKNIRGPDKVFVNKHYGVSILTGSGIQRSDSPENYQGLGAKYTKMPKFVPFGDYYISPQKLYYENVLAVRSRTKQPLTGYRDHRISDAFSSILMKVLKDDTVNRHDIALLNDKERIIYDNLMFMGKMHKSHHNTVDETVQKMKDRFTILEGEIEAGNDNPDILKEIHSLLYKMAKNKIISQKSATEYWTGLKK